MPRNSWINCPRLFLFVWAAFCVQVAVGQQAEFDRESLKIKDSVVLKSGSKLFGTLKSEGKDDNGRKFVLFETEDGALLKLDVVKTLNRSKIHKLDDVDAAYNKHIETLEDTAESHWQLANWCGKQASGSIRFKDQIKFHWERVMELDPNDDNVKRKLGFTYISAENRWVPKAPYHQSHGYEKKGTSWAPVLQREVSAWHDQKKTVEGERKRLLAQWKKNVRKSGSGSASAIQNELFRICDADAVVIFFEEAKDEQNATLRGFYIEAFGRVPTYIALRALCFFAVEDASLANRERALTLIGQEHFNPESAVGVFAGYLGDSVRTRVLRAAFAIGEIGSVNAVLPLVDALITTHQVAPGDQPGRIQTGIGNSGNIENFGIGGDSKPKNRTYQNDAVASALRNITGENFGFNESAWQRWYIENHTHHDIKVRR